MRIIGTYNKYDGRCMNCLAAVVARFMPTTKTLCAKCGEKRRRHRQRAMRAVARAIKKNLIVRARSLRCVDCGIPAHAYDHRDYRHPLRIEPVCTGCNLKRGPAAPFNRYLKQTLVVKGELWEM